MLPYIRKYFASNKTVTLPGIGSFTVETQSAKLDFVEKTLSAPTHVIRYDTYDKVDEAFYNFLEKETGRKDAHESFNGFSIELKEKLNSHQLVVLPGIGTLTKNPLGYNFVADESIQKYFPSVTAERVIRENAEHTVRVGEDERTSTEMHEHFKRTKTKEDKWVVTAIVLGVVGVAAIASSVPTAVPSAVGVGTGVQALSKLPARIARSCASTIPSPVTSAATLDLSNEAVMTAKSPELMQPS